MCCVSLSPNASLFAGRARCLPKAFEPGSACTGRAHCLPKASEPAEPGSACTQWEHARIHRDQSSREESDRQKEFSGPQHAFGAGFFVTFRVFEAGSGRAKLTTWLSPCLTKPFLSRSLRLAWRSSSTDVLSLICCNATLNAALPAGIHGGCGKDDGGGGTIGGGGGGRGRRGSGRRGGGGGGGGALMTARSR